MVCQYKLVLPPYKRGFHLITDEVISAIRDWPDQGMMNVFIQHTSAGLTINENADPTVRQDFETSFRKIVPEGPQGYIHSYEGPDDMPAHIKSSLVGASLTIPISEGRPALGIWQGIYFCEFRNNGGSRKILITVYS